MRTETTFSSRPFEHLFAQASDLRNTLGAAGSLDGDTPTFLAKLQFAASVLPTTSPTETEQTEPTEHPVRSPVNETTPRVGSSAPTYLARIRLAMSVLPRTCPTETGRTETSEFPGFSPAEAAAGQGPSVGFDELVAAAEASVRASESRARAVDIGTVSGVSMGGTARQVTAAALASGGSLDASLARGLGRVSVFRRRLARAGAVAGNVFDGNRLIVVGQS